MRTWSLVAIMLVLCVCGGTRAQTTTSTPNHSTTSSVRISTTTSTTLLTTPCGDPFVDGRVTAADALAVLQAAVGSIRCDLRVCDVDSSLKITAGDALAVLRFAVELPGDLTCPTTPALCGDGVVNQSEELCDGDDNVSCESSQVCGVSCSCVEVPSCGDGVIDQPAEECDGPDAPACPGACESDCTCGSAAIVGFTPRVASVGDLIRVVGRRLASSNGGGPTVSLKKQRGGAIAAPVTSSEPTRLEFVVPTGADTGLIALTVDDQIVRSHNILTIVPSQSFRLLALPPEATVIQGQEITYKLVLESDEGFSQLASLDVSDLPPGIGASLSTSHISLGQSVTLSVSAAANVAAGSVIPFSVMAAASVDGLPISDAENLTLKVEAITTSFIGRTVVDDAAQTPLSGVSVSMLGRNGFGYNTGCSGSAVSDSAGNFVLSNLPPACEGEQLIRYDGSTATNPPGHYAGVDLAYEIIGGQVNVSPVLVHLPRIDNAELVCVVQNFAEEQHVTFDSIPNLAITIYPETIFTPPATGMPQHNCPSGFYPLIAVNVPVDRLPEEETRSNVIDPFIVAFQPANTTASSPVAVYYPNLIDTPPGTSVQLSTLNPVLGRMVFYGTGTVSGDGKEIVPDFDPSFPGTGRRFGIVNFDWHGPSQPPPPGENPAPPGCEPWAGDPVDVGSGLFVLSVTDLAIGSTRGGIAINRVHRTLSAEAGPFGVGTNHNYGYRLDTNDPSARDAINLLLPDGNRFLFARQSDGSFVNSTIPAFRGATMTVSPVGRVSLRWRDGVTFAFSPSNPVLGSVLNTITDRSGNTIEVRRNPDRPARIDAVIDPVGRALSLTYDDGDRVTRIQDPIGRIVRYVYDGSGKLVGVIDAAGGTTRYHYDTFGRLDEIQNPRGVTSVRNTYDVNGRVVTHERADGGVFEFSYVLANPDVPTGPVLETTVVSPATETSSNPVARTTTYRFNPQGYLISLTDALGQTRRFDRESTTNLLLRVSGVADCDVCGDVSAGDVTFTYDQRGNIVTRSDGARNVVTYAYDSRFDMVTSVSDSLGEIAAFTYDSRGNLTTVTDPRGNSTQLEYDATGGITRIEGPDGASWTIAYDEFGNPVEASGPLGVSTLRRFDSLSRPIEVADADGRSTSVAYDLLGRISELTDGRGHTTLIEYDTVGNATRVVDARGNSTTYRYDDMNRLKSRRDSLGREDLRIYDLAGHLISYSDRRGRGSTREYDQLGRLTLETYDDSTVRRRYDAAGRLVNVSDSVAGVFAFEYDDRGLVIGAAGPNGAVTYARDRRGRIDSVNVVGANSIVYGYDLAGNVESITAAGRAFSLRYNQLNLLEELRRPGGVDTVYAYDKLSRPESITHKSSSGVLAQHTYRYDGAGNVISRVSTGLLPFSTAARWIEIDELSDRVLSAGEMHYEYDENGNVLSERSPDGTTAFVWDARNRLRSMTRPNGATIGFEYNFARELVALEVREDGHSERTAFLRDDLSSVVAIRLQSQPAATVVPGRWVDQYVAAIGVEDDVIYPLADSIGSVAATTDDSASTVRSSSFEPFGASAGDETGFPFGYAGRLPVSDDLYYSRARFYSTTLGRFLSEDPIGYGGEDFNLYRYVENNPLAWSDPSGLRRGRHYNAEDTSNLINDAVKRFGLCNVVWGMVPCAWVHFSIGSGEGAYYDFKLVEPKSTFVAPGRGCLNSPDFGNYLAGYVITSILGDGGTALTKLGGRIHAWFEGQDEDPTYIDQGAEDARRDKGWWWIFR